MKRLQFDAPLPPGPVRLSDDPSPPGRCASGHAQILATDLLDRLHDRWLATPGLEPRLTVLDVLEDLAALGCERAGAMLERERRRPAP
jgi:hypothetical protein